MKQLEGKTILVTGASGFIGAHLAKRLARIAGIKLLLLSRQIQQSNQTNVRWLNEDLRHLKSAYWDSHNISRIDYIFHLGAFTPKRAAEANQTDRAIEDNILATQRLLESVPGKPRKILFASTVDVYSSASSEEVMTEQSEVRSSSVYGASKLFCESLVSAWAKEKRVDCALLRYGHIYGPGEEKYQKLIPTVIRNLAANQAPLVHGDGSALRDFLYVDDAVEATLRASVFEGSVGPVNIVRSESASLKEVVSLLIRLMKSDKKIEFLRDKPNGASFRFDSTLMEKLLGNWPKVGLEQGLAVEVASFRGEIA